MQPAPILQLFAFIAFTYLATYGAGAGLLRLARLRLASWPERVGVACALGCVVQGWVGYGAVMGRVPWLASGLTYGLGAVGVYLLVCGVRRRQWPWREMNRTEGWLLGLAVVIGLLYAAGMNYWQLAQRPEGTWAGRFLWPDLLYRNAVMSGLLAFDGLPDWPWLAGVPMKGMSLLRFTAIIPTYLATGLGAVHYHGAALWLGLFGVPVAAGAGLAFFRAVGASGPVAALAVLFTAILGNPRWLLDERFAHSPALHWAGTDVFAIAVPVLLALLALTVWAVREPRRGTLGLAVMMLLSGPGHVPWMALSLYVALPVWALVQFGQRHNWRQALTLGLGALGGVAVLKLLMGTGSGGGSPLAALGPSGLIRNLSWAFPFLNEPLKPLLATADTTSLLKLGKFGAVYGAALLFYLGGSLWVRNLMWLELHRWHWPGWRQPVACLSVLIGVAGAGLSGLVDFNKLAFQGAQYDALRLLWPALLLANWGLAQAVWDRRAHWCRGAGLLLLLVVLFYGSWENSQVVLWSRSGLPWSTLPVAETAALRALQDRVHPGDIVLINPQVTATAPEGLRPGDELLGHPWGYVTGLLPCRAYLDNEDMARKFGQRPLWEERQAAIDDLLAEPRAEAVRQRLQQWGINWLLLQGDDELTAPLALPEVFRQGKVRVYEVPSATWP
jgi:hypothetical protein